MTRVLKFCKLAPISIVLNTVQTLPYTKISCMKYQTNKTLSKHYSITIHNFETRRKLHWLAKYQKNCHKLMIMSLSLTEHMDKTIHKTV